MTGLARILPFVPGHRLPSFIFLVISAVLFLASAVRPDNMQAVRNGVTDLFAPVLAAVNAPVQGAASYVRAVSGLASLQAENERLRTENERLRAWYQKALVLQSENETLQKMANMKISAPHKYVTARIIADSGNSYARSVLVMAGTANGVQKGQAVTGAEGLMGRIIQAGSGASRVLLVNDINARVPVFVEGSNIQAVAAGDGGAQPALIHLPPETALQEGARILTSGHGGLYPYGIPVGTVVRTGEDKWGVNLFSDIDRTIYVRVIDSESDPNLQESVGR